MRGGAARGDLGGPGGHDGPVDLGGPGGHDGPGRFLLALDTATATALVALADRDGTLRRAERWVPGHRHGEELLGRIADLLAAEGVDRRDLAAIVVGTGPGAFTGLRVGIATAKGLAHGLGIPLVGVPTGTALLAAAGGARTGGNGPLALLLPAGPSDRVLVGATASPELLPGGHDPSLRPGTTLVAIDLPGRAPADALERGAAALEGLAGTLVRLGAERLAAGATGELPTLVPDYVTLPRGVRQAVGEVAWSHDRR